MIQVTIGTNTSRKNYTVDPNRTIRDVLENEAGFDYSTANMSLDGATLQPGDLDKTFAALGITSKCYLIAIVKADNAR
jgi:hypothetical protein